MEVRVKILFFIFVTANSAIDVHKENATRCVLISQPLAKEIKTNDVQKRQENINNIQGLDIRMVEVDGSLNYETLVSYILRVFPKDGFEGVCSAVIGVVGDLDSQTASVIHTLASRANLSITMVASYAPSSFLPVTSLDLPNVLDMNPLDHYIEALVTFTLQQNWTRIGVISDNTAYYRFAADRLQQQYDNAASQRTVTPFIRRHRKDGLNHILPTLQEYRVQVVVILMSQQDLCSLLKEAETINYNWPNRVWVMFDSDFSYSSKASCNLQGMIILKELFIRYDMRLGVASIAEYSTILQDSVLAVALSDSLDFSNGSFTGASGLVEFKNGRRLNNFSFVQIYNNTSYEVAYYNSKLQEFAVFSDVLTTSAIGSGELPVIYYQNTPAEIAVIAVVITSCFIFVTTVLVLFIYFRKEPEIKATSFSVSLCMFTGCYLLLLLSYLFLIEAQPASKFFLSTNIICNVLAWLTAIGLPISLILSTLFMKMLRVYSIFADPLSYRKKLFTNYHLLLYIVLMMSPTIFILILWTTVHPFINMELRVDMQSHVMIFETCKSEQDIIWIILLLLYTSFLIVSVIALALKTSKIRHNYFKDTKNTNMFAFLTIFITAMTAVYWYFFDNLPPTPSSFIAVYAILYTGHLSIVLLCQILLFVPKVYPPLKRWLVLKCKKKAPTRV